MTRNLQLFFLSIAVLLSACNSNEGTKVTDNDVPGVHKITIQEVLQASAYTYLHGKEGRSDIWLAVPSMIAKAGEIYYYKGGIQMTKFESKELNREFESITLLDRVSADPNGLAAAQPPVNAEQYAPATPDGTAPAANTQPSPAPGQNDGASYTRTQTPPEKKEVKVTAAPGGITIGELFAKKDFYAGKTVKIKGQVTKYTPAVMNKNWIHIQDGTSKDGKFDLTVTSEAETTVGETVTLEGKISLNKDLGYGYFFEVIMENAAKK